MVSSGSEGWRAKGVYDPTALIMPPILNWMNSGTKGAMVSRLLIIFCTSYMMKSQVLVLDKNSTLTLSTLNDVPGEDYVRNLDIADIDFATIHVYPDSWGIPPRYYTWVNDNFIGDRAALAAAHGKPLMLEVCHLHTTDTTGLLYLHPIIILSSY